MATDRRQPENPPANSGFTESELEFLTEAAKYLERPSLLLRLADTVGKPLELISGYAPAVVSNAVNAALERAMTLAVTSLEDESWVPARARFALKSPFWHNVAGAVSGAGGGFFGLPGLAVELPVTTTIMLRSIAATAQQQGEDLNSAEVRLQCLTVFSLGGPSRLADREAAGPNAMESSYLTARVGLQEAVTAAARFAAKVSADELVHMVRRGTAPVLVQLIGRVASQFNFAVSQKLIAQSVPVIGAAGGAAVNVAFIDHFNRVARFHFGIRALERKYGNERVQNAYRQAVRSTRQAPRD